MTLQGHSGEAFPGRPVIASLMRDLIRVLWGSLPVVQARRLASQLMGAVYYLSQREVSGVEGIGHPGITTP